MRRSWLTTHVLADAAGAAAHAAATGLGPTIHESLLAAGDRLAAVSPGLAQRFYLQAAGAWTAFGADGFRRWLALGESVAAGCREGGLAWFALPPARLDPLADAEAWAALGLRVASASRRLGAAYFERTAPLLAAPDGLARLAAWVDAGLALHEAPGWRSAVLAQAWFDAAPAALFAFEPDEYPRWALVAQTLAPVLGEREATVPPALDGWTAAERVLFLRAVHGLAVGGPPAAVAVFRAFPAQLADATADERTALLRVVAAIGPRHAAALAALVPELGVLLAAVPPAQRGAGLGLVEELAGRAPDAALAALRSLPRLYGEATPARVRDWFAAGGAASEAWFALETRASLRVLRAGAAAADLDASEGVWRKLVQMLSGAPIRLHAVEEATLRPPLAVTDDDGALPARIDWLATAADNERIYRLLAAQLAGRRQFASARPPGLADSPAHEDLFLLAEGVRVHHRLSAAYRGLAADMRNVAQALLVRFAQDDEPARSRVLDALQALAMVPDGAPPPWLPPPTVALVRGLLAPLSFPDATSEDSWRAAGTLAAILGTRVDDPTGLAAEIEALLAMDDSGGPESSGLDAEGEPGGASAPHDGPRAEDAKLALGEESDAPPGGGRALSPEELLRLLAAGARIEQGHGDDLGPGLPITDLLGKIAPEQLDALRRLLAAPERDVARGAGATRATTAEGAVWYYDEWDHRIADYRTRWCRLTEVNLGGDSGEFFLRALADHARLVPEVRRLFQRIRPAQYRTVRGLEDGEDFDLNAVIDARVEARARRSPSTRLYRARVREARDVATLFLLDMSASTDEPLVAGTEGAARRRIIDAIKEALVVMTEALDELGDAYAIYGFSGEGRHGVEVYPVKAFGERLGGVVKARIGAIEPRRSTRMGPALRHATRKLVSLGARAKHLLLLSDGFPQDHDYGDDRRSHLYGIRDTAVALREAERAGVAPFCITVDRAGHDYLREMCESTRYLVIEDVAALPRELPKIYRRVVTA